MKRTIKILLIILLIATLLRGYQLHNKEFGTDEDWSIKQTEQVLDGSFFEHAGKHAHPPLFYTILAPLWTVSNQSVMMLRLLMVCFSLASIYLIFLLGKKICSEKTGLLAAALLAFSPFHIMYSQHIRSYILLMCLAIITTILLINYVQKRRTSIAVSLVILYIAMFYLHTLTAFFILTHFIILGILWIGKEYTINIKEVIIAGIITAVGMALWLPVFIMQYTHNITEGAIKTLSTLNPLHVPYVLYKYAVGMDISAAIKSHPYAIALAAVIISFVGFGCWKTLKQKRKNGIILCGSLFLPTILLAVMGIFFPVFSFRYVSYLLPLFIVLFAKGINEIKNKKLRWVIIMITIVIWLLVIQAYWLAFIVYKWGHSFAL